MISKQTFVFECLFFAHFVFGIIPEVSLMKLIISMALTLCMVLLMVFGMAVPAFCIR